jgi:peptide/nickel transport system substrate-binding protein
VIATPAEPSHLDQTTSSDARQYLNGNVYQPLVWVNHDLTTEPMLAESWEQAEPTVWRFKIRQGVKFHNGESMTVDDVVASLKFQTNPDNAADQLNLLGPIVDVRAVDDETVEIETSAISPVQPTRLLFGPIAPRSIVEGDRESLQATPVGTGPYKLKSWARGSELVLDRFADYWGDEPHFDEVVFRFIPEENVQLQSIAAGEVDLAALGVDLAKEAPQTIALDTPGMLGIRIDCVKGPTSDFRVRQALNMAIDRQEIIDTLYGGYGEPISQIVPPTSPGYLEELKPIEYDPDRAKQLIDEAGATGETLSMLAWSDTGDRDFVEAVVPLFEAIGLKIDLQFGDFDTWLNQGIFGNAKRGTEDPIDLVVFGHNDTLGDPFRQWDTMVLCESHYGTMCEPEIEDLVEQSRVEADPEKALELHQEINRRTYEEVLPWIMVKTTVAFYGASEGLQFDGHPEGLWPAFKMSRA